MKFIKTEVDEKAVRLKLSNCNYCPYFKFNIADKTCVCRKYVNNNGENSSNVILKRYNYELYNFIYLPILETPIPEWCNLPSQETDVDNEYTLSVLKEDYMISQFVSTKKDLDIINDETVIYRNGKLVTKTVITRSYLYIKPLNNTICSSCGKSKDDVNRKENLGMCNECWNLYSKNEIKKHFAYINNFRIKRQSTYKEIKYKKVKFLS